jgi:hypothetical protein
MDVFGRDSSGNILASGSASGSVIRFNVDIPSWTTLGQRPGYSFVKAVDIIKDQYSQYSYSGYLTGSISAQLGKWFGSVLGPNGCVYGIPSTATSSIKIDTNTSPETVSYISSSFTPVVSGWVGGVLAPNGKIYCGTNLATNILVINTSTDTLSTITALVSLGAPVLANDGNPYFVAASYIGKVNTADDTFATFGSLSGASYVGGVLAPNNGCIYFVPYSSTAILKLNPVTQQFTTFGNIPQSGKWAGGVLGPNGLIYCIPFDSTGSLIINPFNDTFVVSGSLSIAGNKYYGGALGLDGNVYATGNVSSAYLKINTSTGQLTQTALAVGSKFGMTLAPNGKMYSVPFSSTNILVLSMNVSSSVDSNIPLSRYLNHF